MNYAIKPLQDWFAENAMNPVFALSEFCKTFHVLADVQQNNEVTFSTTPDSTFNSDIDGSVFEFGTWIYLRNIKDVKSSTLAQGTGGEKKPEPTRNIKK